MPFLQYTKYLFTKVWENFTYVVVHALRNLHVQRFVLLPQMRFHSFPLLFCFTSYIKKGNSNVP